MVGKEAILEFLSKQKQEWERSFGVSSLGLFGSFALGQNDAASDIDILVSFRQDTPNIREKKVAIRQILQQQFGRSVDVCNERYLKPFFREAIQKEAVYV